MPSPTPELPLLVAWQRTTHRLLRALDGELADLGLSTAEINALACLDRPDRLPVGALGEATGQRPSTLTGVLDRLEGRRLVVRRPAPGDRRSTEIVLTAEGRRAANAVASAFAGLEARLAPAEAVRQALAAVDAAVEA